MMTLTELRERLTERHGELQEELEALPQAQALQQRIDTQRDNIARLTIRRDRLAAYGSKQLEIPYPSAWLPEYGQGFLIDVEPLRSAKTGKQLAADVQLEIDEYEADIRECRREIAKLLKRRRS
jgi:hypothetical protein